MRLICTNKKSFYIDKITIVDVLNFLAPTVDSFKVLVLNSYEGEKYYYTEDIKDLKSVNEIVAFFESKDNLKADVFSINIDGILIEIDDDYTLSAFSENISSIEAFTQNICSGFLNYSDDLIEKILHLGGKYAMVDLGIIVKEFLTFDDYLDEIK